MRTFGQRVFAIVREIPLGSTLSYKEVAQRVGSPSAFRAVGSVLKTNFNPSIPCHRVIKSSGEIGNYNRGGTKEKRKILFEEGVLAI
ncbi:MAG TPA: 6-O-methylguanine DNA methyltransferase [Candidatus Taylorbacteria bacterium]|nr:MAG: Methylated DNA-protein cysteine methyltransferase [Parcubacteria group bacterium GW2011_GWA2_47_64]KKU96051.1 MAG: Methylated DNA-protein cysteine methyltransferase [Parcubacteria group bacterium GW2011_GWC2_48_17]HBV00829.1 6-O-methylguanine DNA methyltransferase [Candidatus Taylorbacteria bacterium]